MEPESEHHIMDEHTPLLQSDRLRIASTANDFLTRHILSAHGEDSYIYRVRHFLQYFLTSKAGHYAVILLVSLDVTCIFADFLITLHICEHTGCHAGDGGPGKEIPTLEKIDEGLDVVSLVFSCLFLAELVASVFAFGFSYFKSKFHCFDAFVILVAFIVDVVLHGIVEEVGSLVVVLRLWRVFKIIEEFSAAGEEQLDTLQERIEQLEKENEQMKTTMRKDVNNIHDG